jgi:hypothetical protein
LEGAAVGRLAQKCNTIAPELHGIKEHVRRRIQRAFGEASDGTSFGKLNQKAERWWEATPNQLGAALKTSFKLTSNPMLNPRTADEWEPYLVEKRGQVEQLTRELADIESEINERVYRLFNLTADEIALLQKEVEH